MAFLSHPYRFVCSALLLQGLALSVAAQTTSNQPPANYRGPDTYGMCAYVIGDTEYYGRSFYTSSYFRAKAEQEVREYAQSQAKGVPVRAHCIWSYKESDLATTKETDRRLIGMPGHPAKAVESGWTFHGGTTNGNSAAVGATGSTANSAVNGTQTAYARRTAATSTGTTYANSAANGAVNSSNTVSRGYNTATNSYNTATTTTGASAATAASGSTGSTTTGSLMGGAQQSLSDAKTSAVSTAAGGMSTATNSAMGALTNGMQNMFHRKQAQPQQTNVAANGGENSVAAIQNQPSVAGPAAEGAGFGLAAGVPLANSQPVPAPVAAPASAPVAPPAAASVEGVVADVSGKDVIINVGQQAGVQPGTTLVVMHPQRTVKDPVTGKALRTIESAVGELKITGADAQSASGVFSGSGVPVVGDKVRTKQ